MTDNATEQTETATEQRFNSRDAIRKGFLAYIGLYGAAYEGARKFVNGKGTDLFNDIVKKGEEIEGRAQESYEDFRKRVGQKYADQRESIEKFFARVSNDDSVEDEAVAAKGPARKRSASKSVETEAA